MDVARADRDRLRQLAIEAEGELLGADRVEVGVDQLEVRVVRIIGDRTEVERLDEGPRAARGTEVRRIGAGDRRPVEGVEREVPVHPAVGAEHHAAESELHLVVEHPPAAVGLHLAVAVHVPGEADPRRDLLAEAEVDAGVVLAVRGDVLPLAPQPQIQGEAIVDGPRVLNEEPDAVGGDVPLQCRAG